MKNGKISESVLKRSVLKQLHTKLPGTFATAGVGSDFAAFETERDTLVITASAAEALMSRNLAERAVCKAVNNVAVSGALPYGIEVTLTVPTIWNEAQLRELMRDVDLAAAKYPVQVLGGHTQASRAVKEAVISVTAFGTVPKELLVGSSGAKPGMELILAGWIAMEGTALLAVEKQAELRTRFAQPFLDKAAALGQQMSVARAARIAAENGAAAMHDLSEGGIFGALWEFAEAGGIGLEIDLKKIPVRQETIEIAEFFDLNPYKLLSAGALLIASGDSGRIVRALEAEGIPAAVIGVATDSNDRVLIQQGERRFIETVQTDEIYKVFEA